MLETLFYKKDFIKSITVVVSNFFSNYLEQKSQHLTEKSLFLNICSIPRDD